MNILFDIFVLIPEMEAEMTFEERAIFGEIIKLFESRLSLLKTEIEAEERNDNTPCCVMIHFLPPQEQITLPKNQQDQNIRITANGYSKPLVEKINNCFTDKDFELLNDRLQSIADSFRN